MKGSALIVNLFDYVWEVIEDRADLVISKLLYDIKIVT